MVSLNLAPDGKNSSLLFFLVAHVYDLFELVHDPISIRWLVYPEAFYERDASRQMEEMRLFSLKKHATLFEMSEGRSEGVTRDINERLL